MRRCRVRCGLAILVALAGTALAGGAWAADELPVGPGSKLVYAKCQACHSLQYVEDAKGLLPKQWASTLAGMQDYGLTVTDDEKQQILAYLTTYMGPNPPPEAPAATPGRPEKLDGKAVFEENCATCHGADGNGQPGSYPPLAGNPDVAHSADFPALVALNGISGTITVKGQNYDGTMPPFGHLSDDEIAAAVNYVRGAWGNDGLAGAQRATLDAGAVAKLRKEKLAPQDVAALLSAKK